VIRFREEISDRLTKLETEILIEQKLHIEAVISRLSRSAAYARQARMSSSVNSGKSSRICLWVWPAASHPSTSATAIRMWRMQGRPPRLPGSMEMMCW
jgi:hypothetical protein